MRRPELHITREQAEKIVEQFELNGGRQVSSDEIQMLERFFLWGEKKEVEDLSERYGNALRNFISGLS